MYVFNSCLEITMKLLLNILVLCLFLNVEASANLLESDVANGEEEITSIATENADNKDNLSVTKEKQNQYKKVSPAKKLNAAQLFEQQMLAKKKTNNRKVKRNNRRNDSRASSNSNKSSKNKPSYKNNNTRSSSKNSGGNKRSSGGGSH